MVKTRMGQGETHKKEQMKADDKERNKKKSYRETSQR